MNLLYCDTHKLYSEYFNSIKLNNNLNEMKNLSVRDANLQLYTNFVCMYIVVHNMQ